MGIINDPSKLQSEEIQHPANSSTQKVYIISNLFRKNQTPECVNYYKSNATDTNYFTTFLQTADVALVIFK